VGRGGFTGSRGVDVDRRRQLSARAFVNRAAVVLAELPYADYGESRLSQGSSFCGLGR